MRRGNFGAQWLVVTERRILVLDERGIHGVVEIPLKDVVGARTEALVGGAYLEIRASGAPRRSRALFSDPGPEVFGSCPWDRATHECPDAERSHVSGPNPMRNVRPPTAREERNLPCLPESDGYAGPDRQLYEAL